MNIFYLDKEPDLAAMYHCNIHVLSQVRETAELLSSAHMYACTPGNEYLKTGRVSSHLNHPSAKWVRSSVANYEWLANLGLCLSYEYGQRFKKAHAFTDMLVWLYDNVPDKIPDTYFSPPTLVMPDIYKSGDHVESYRNYYLDAKLTFASGRRAIWTVVDEPWWVTEYKKGLST